MKIGLEFVIKEPFPQLWMWMACGASGGSGHPAPSSSLANEEASGGGERIISTLNMVSG